MHLTTKYPFEGTEALSVSVVINSNPTEAWQSVACKSVYRLQVFMQHSPVNKGLTEGHSTIDPILMLFSIVYVQVSSFHTE